MYKQIRDLVLFVSLDGRIIEANDAALKAYGYTRGELLKKTVYDLRHTEPVQLIRQQMAQAEKQGITFETMHYRKDGSAFPVEVSSKNADLDGERVLLSIIRDISERKRIEAVLQKSEKEKSLILDGIAEIVLYCDLGMRILWANRAASKFTGLTRKQLNGRHCHEVFFSSSNVCPDCLFKNAVSGAQLVDGEIKKIRGRTIFVRGYPVLDQHETAMGLVFIARDITERKKAEAELAEVRARANRAERLASLGTLAAGVAHEINQPLNSLKIIADSLLYWYSVHRVLNVDEVVEELNKISRQAERIGSIINRMRLFVKSEHKTQLSHCNLNDAVESALNMIGYQFSAHGINVEKSLSRRMPFILADQQKLEEVVINLTLNAMQALNTTGKPDKQISIITNFENNNIILEISDNATGVDQDMAHKIFEPFFTTKEAGLGMGLGLSIVYSIVTSFEGQIHVQKNRIGGATFRVEFPAPNLTV